MYKKMLYSLIIIGDYGRSRLSWGQANRSRMFSCTNKIEASLPFSSINPQVTGYVPCARDSLSRWSGLEWILRPWPSAQLLQEKAVSVDSRNVLENVIFPWKWVQSAHLHNGIPTIAYLGLQNVFLGLSYFLFGAYKFKGMCIGTAFVFDYLGPGWGVILP